ncbi:MAG: phosphoribosylamine--glycine ligase, partial [Lachnospiraceae bacterium]|nr:phosphoribosylamine--glycine ligase [Lachnospiraceae bacterium]
CVDGTLDKIELDFADNAAVCVVLASDGYPEKYDKGFEITGFENFKAKDGYYVFHAGTKFNDGKIVTNGGRVLGVTALGTDLKDARANAYKATEWIDFANKYKRNDIGKAIDEA